MVAAWKEEGSRGLAHVAMGDFPTVADAIFEIADNPLDYRHGRPLVIEITIDKDGDRIVVEDRGGEGMDSDGIADWLRWGTGHPHAAGDIGKYHKGGKAACGYLGQSIEILTRRAGQTDVWRLVDTRWKDRPDWADFGEPTPYPGPIPRHLSALPREVGFTRMAITNLEERRYNVADLKWMLGNTYRRLIAEKAVTFLLNGEEVEPLELPLSTAFKERREVVTTQSGRRIKVWIGRLDRDAVKSGPHRIQGGVRMLFQRRLIGEGEYFGHHAEGKGLLASLIGEAEMNHLEPLSNKTGFKRGTLAWDEAEEAMRAYLAPIIADFRRAAEEHPVTREERKRAALVRRQLATALSQLATGNSAGGSGASRDGRRRPEKGGEEAERADTGRTRRPPTPRTEAPDDAVGALQRLRKRLRPGEHVPPIELADLDPSMRSEAIHADGAIVKIVVNRQFPMYRLLGGREAYIAETALMELLMPSETERTLAPAYVAQVNQCIDAWARIAEDGDGNSPRVATPPRAGRS